MAKCKYCNAENQPDEEFCHKCGKDLDTTIKVTSRKSRKANFSLGKALKRIFKLLVIVVIVGALYSIVYPSVFLTPKLPELSKSQISQAKKELNSVKYRRANEHIFTADELTYLFNNVLTGDEPEENPLIISTIDNQLAFTVNIQLTSYLNYKTPLTVIASPEYDFNKMEKYVAGFDVKKIILGKLPLPESYWSYCLPYFDGYLNKKTKKLLKKVFDIKVNADGSITIEQLEKKGLFKSMF